MIRSSIVYALGFHSFQIIRVPNSMSILFMPCNILRICYVIKSTQCIYSRIDEANNEHYLIFSLAS